MKLVKELQPGDLIRLKQGVHGAGEIGLILNGAPNSWSAGIYEVMYKDRIRMCHVNNMDVINETKEL